MYISFRPLTHGKHHLCQVHVCAKCFARSRYGSLFTGLGSDWMALEILRANGLGTSTAHRVNQRRPGKRRAGREQVLVRPFRRQSLVLSRGLDQAPPRHQDKDSHTSRHQARAPARELRLSLARWRASGGLGAPARQRSA